MRCSQAVTHRSTIRTQRCLTSVSGRELVDPAWYGRWRDARLRVLHLVWSGAFKIPDEVKKKWSAKCVCNS